MNKRIFSPKLISTINDIKTITSSQSMTYFLSNGGFIYFCGHYYSSGETISAMIPEQLETNNNFMDLPQIDSFYNNYRSHSIVVLTNIKLYQISGNQLIETNYNNFIDFYANELQMTYKTFIIDYKSCFNECYDKTFDQLRVIGSGGFGTVFKVSHKFDGQIYSVKRIQINGIH